MTTKNYTLAVEQDHDFRAWRWLNPDRKQIFAILISHRRQWNHLKPAGRGCLRFVFKFLIGSGSGTNGGFTLSIGWRSDSRDWQRNHRAKRLGLFGTPLEFSRSANGPYISR